MLKDARERFSLRIERDCVGCSGAVGKHIIDRAMRMGQELPGIEDRVDASDCAQKWWSDEPETEAEVEVRLKNLWKRLLEEDCDDSCVLVTHSNLIKAMMMHFGGVDVGENEQDWRGLPMNSTEEPPVDLGKTVNYPYESDPEDLEIGDPWQVVTGGSDALRTLKIERLQNCGVLGLRCVDESPAQRFYPEVDGWIDLDESHQDTSAPFPSNWVARDALLMFDSVLVK